jgi:hypothetical protein
MKEMISYLLGCSPPPPPVWDADEGKERKKVQEVMFYIKINSSKSIVDINNDFVKVLF